MKQHKWHKEIKAWADGEEIEYRVRKPNTPWLAWETVTEPYWHINNYLETEYRIKPQPKEPQYLYAFLLEVGKEQGRIVFGLDDSHVDGFSYIGKIKLEVEE